METISNKSKRHYTLKINGNIYRTTQMTKEEFNEAYYYTENDWIAFLKYGSYIKIK